VKREICPVPDECCEWRARIAHVVAGSVEFELAALDWAGGSACAARR
jgi:hypothetical protein